LGELVARRGRVEGRHWFSPIPTCSCLVVAPGVNFVVAVVFVTVVFVVAVVVVVPVVAERLESCSGRTKGQLGYVC
jgi:hypothetical protein